MIELAVVPLLGVVAFGLGWLVRDQQREPEPAAWVVASEDEEGVTQYVFMRTRAATYHKRDRTQAFKFRACIQAERIALEIGGRVEAA